MQPPRIVRHTLTGSTNDSAAQELSERGGPVWVVADEQRGGRGRRGRAWHSPSGNLYASLALDAPLGPDALNIVPLACGVALAQAIADVAPVAPQLKWPNDVLIGGAKVAGILVEAQHRGGQRTVVLGFGVNVAAAPMEGAACLSSFAACDRDAVFAHLCRHLVPLIERLIADGEAAIAALRDEWLARAVGVGDEIVVRFEDREAHGRFVGLDARGRLILAGPGGTTHIHSGNVFLSPRPA